VKEKVFGSGVGVKALVKTVWVVPLSFPPCVIVPLVVPFMQCHCGALLDFTTMDSCELVM
jgi:hypothetical protein